MLGLIDDSEQSGFDVYAEAMRACSFSKNLVSHLWLPGHANGGAESCGHWRLAGCLESTDHEHNGGQIQKVPMYCYSKNCNICFEEWCKREASAMTDRLMNGKALIASSEFSEKPRKRKLLHLVISPPVDIHEHYKTKEGRKKMRKKMLQKLESVCSKDSRIYYADKAGRVRYKIQRTKNLDGGLMVDHAYRFTKGLKSARFSPHFHVIVTGWVDYNKIKHEYEKAIIQNDSGYDKVLVKHISTLDSEKDVYNVCKYLLSHSTSFLENIKENTGREHALRYFGKYSYNKFKSLSENGLLRDIDLKRYLMYAVNPKNDPLIEAITYKLIPEDDITSPPGYTALWGEWQPLEKSINHLLISIKREYEYATGELKSEIDDGHNITEIGRGEYSVLERDYPAFAKSKTIQSTFDPDFEIPELASMESILPFGLESIKVRYAVKVKITDPITSIVKSKTVCFTIQYNDSEICAQCARRLRTIHYVGPPELFPDIPEKVQLGIEKTSDYVYATEALLNGEIPSYPYIDKDTNLIGFNIALHSNPPNASALNDDNWLAIQDHNYATKIRYEHFYKNGEVLSSPEVRLVLKSTQNPLVLRPTNELKMIQV